MKKMKEKENMKEKEGECETSKPQWFKSLLMYQPKSSVV